jgi:hypothetical protein
MDIFDLFTPREALSSSMRESMVEDLVKEGFGYPTLACTTDGELEILHKKIFPVPF